MAAKPRVKIPQSAAIGDVIEVKTLITHVMETGNRKDKDGKVIPRNIIHTFLARFAGKDIFKGELNSGISANPFIAFYMRVDGPGEFEFIWTDDEGQTYTEKAVLSVSQAAQ